MSRLLRLLAVVLAVVTLPVGAAEPAPADSGAERPTIPQSLSVEELRSLRATLGDPQARQRWLALVDERIAEGGEGTAGGGASVPPSPIPALARDAFTDATDALARELELLRAVPDAAARAVEALQDPARRTRWLRATAWVAATVAVFLITAWVLRRLLRAPERRLVPRPGTTGVWTAVLAALRALLAALPALAALVAAGGVALLTPADSDIRALALIAAFALALRHAALMVLDVLVAPVRADGHGGIFPDGADRFRTPLRRVVGVLAVAGALLACLEVLAAQPATARVVAKLSGLALVFNLIVLVRRNRVPVAARLRGEAAADSARGQVAATWHLPALVVVLGAYVAFALGGNDSMRFMAGALAWTAGVLVAVALARLGVKHLMARILRWGQVLEERFPELASRPQRYHPAVERLANGMIYVAGTLGLLEAWGLKGLAWLGSPVGQALVATASSVLGIAVMALLAIEVGVITVERALRGKRGSARRLTILPLARNVIYVAVALVAGLMLLSELGVNITPLLAGAGVLGIAIGFGAQSLVQDIITGFFILLEDSLAVGDWVDVGSHFGQVETLSLRALRLRDFEGCLHTVPFSKVQTVINMSRDYNYALMDIRVGYEAHMETVLDAMRSVDQAMQADPEWQPVLSGEPVEIFGLERIADSSLEIRIRVRTAPGKHWMVRREFLRRVREELSERGIQLPLPRQALYLDRQAAIRGVPAGPPDQVLSSAPSADDPTTPTR